MGQRPRELRATCAVAFALAAFLPGCELLMGNVVPASTEPCSTDEDCPTSQWCAGFQCRDACGAGSCPTGTECDTVAGHSVCIAPAVGCSVDAGPDCSGPDAGSLPGVGGGAVPPDCSACDPTTSVCIANVCRVLSWSATESQISEPLPAPIGSRIYFGVPRNELYAQYVPIPKPGLLLRLGLLASTAPSQNGALFGLSLYSDVRHFPSEPLVQPPLQASDTTTADTGRQEVLIDPPVHVPAGDYWVAFFVQTQPYVLQGTGAQLETAEGVVAAGTGPWLAPFPSDSTMPTSTIDAAVIMYATMANDPP